MKDLTQEQQARLVRVRSALSEELGLEEQRKFFPEMSIDELTLASLSQWLGPMRSMVAYQDVPEDSEYLSGEDLEEDIATIEAEGLLDAWKES